MTKSQTLVRNVLIGRGIEVPDSPRHPGLQEAITLVNLFYKNFSIFAANSGFKSETHIYSSTTGVPSDWGEIALTLGELQFRIDHTALDFGFPANTRERKYVVEWLHDQAIVRRFRTPHHLENYLALDHINAIHGKAKDFATALGLEIDIFHHGQIPRSRLADIKKSFADFQATLDHAATRCGLDLQRIIHGLRSLKLKDAPYKPDDLIPLLRPA